MKVRSIIEGVAAIGLCLGLAACAASAPTEPGGITDPFEGWNRAMHKANHTIDQNLLRPAAIVYDTVTPDLTQHLIGNGLDYLTYPRTLVNQTLQGNFQGAGETAARMFVNATLGLGVLDPATDFGIPKHNEDFGQTLAAWGVGEGYYHEFLFFGPYTTRGALAYFADVPLDPLNYLGFFGVPGATASGVRGSETGLRVLRFREENDAAIQDVYAAEDSYVTLRSAFIQNRRAQIRNGETEIEDLPDIYEGSDF